MSTQQITIKDSAAASKLLLAQENADGSVTFFHAEDVAQRTALMTVLAGQATEAKLEMVRALLAGTLAVSASTLPLPVGAATDASLASIKTTLTLASTAALQSAANTSLASISTALSSTLKTDTVVVNSSTNKGATVGTTAQVLIAANASRRGFVIQNQSATATIYINGLTTATTDYNSLAIGPGQYYETQTHHVGAGAISVIASAASTSVYAREF